MKIKSIIIVLVTVIAAGAWVFYYVNDQSDDPSCNANILTTNIVGCDITGATK